MSADDGVHLLKLNSLATDLDLCVFATNVFDAAI
jgi:hypothetical protein